MGIVGYQMAIQAFIKRARSNDNAVITAVFLINILDFFNGRDHIVDSRFGEFTAIQRIDQENIVVFFEVLVIDFYSIVGDMSGDFWVSLIFLSIRTLYPASPSLRWVA